jgi:hypothetical protein
LIYLRKRDTHFEIRFSFAGVGGWVFDGVDPREYSSSFAIKCKEAVDQVSIREPKKIMEYANSHTLNIKGSTSVNDTLTLKYSSVLI